MVMEDGNGEWLTVDGGRWTVIVNGHGHWLRRMVMINGHGEWSW